MDQAQARALLAGERARWAALQRAEARFAAGSYGRSVHSGQPIGDERLEADALAELTLEEAAAAERGPARGGRRRACPKAEPVPPRRA